MLNKLRDTAMQQGMKLMGDPRFMKFMSSPTGQKVMTVAFQLPGKVESAFAAQGKAFARRFKLATRAEVDQLKSTVRTLEQALRTLEQKNNNNNNGG